MSTWMIRAYGRVGADLAGHPVVEAHPEGEEQVGRLDGLVDVLPAVHAHVAIAERMRLVDRADAEERVGDGDLRLLGEGPQVVPRLGEQDAVAGQDHRPLGVVDLLRGQLELARMAVEVGLKPGSPAMTSSSLGCCARRLLLQRVLRDVDVDRPGASGRAMWKASARTRGSSSASRTR